jgi:hypothetical protein
MSTVSKYLKVLEVGRLLPNDVNPDIKEEKKVRNGHQCIFMQ